MLWVTPSAGFSVSNIISFLLSFLLLFKTQTYIMGLYLMGDAFFVFLKMSVLDKHPISNQVHRRSPCEDVMDVQQIKSNLPRGQRRRDSEEIRERRTDLESCSRVSLTTYNQGMLFFCSEL